MKKKLLLLTSMLMLTLTLNSLFGSALALAEEARDEAEIRELLQKGLTIYEIDREVGRLNAQDASLTDQIQAAERDIALQDAKVQKTRKHAGKVLRSYYTGERDSIWLLIFSVSSFTDALKVIEYLQLIVQNDHRALNNYKEAFDRLTALKTTLESSQAELRATKERYLQQRARVVELQAELDRLLAASAHGAEIQKQIKTMNEDWQEKGLPLFRLYFEQLSAAFLDLPQFLSDGKHLDLSSYSNPILTIPDKEFNTFLRGKNELFESLEFRFENGQIHAAGHKDGLDIAIAGNFVLKEGQTMNEVRFEVESLTFNGYELPDTTIEELKQSFQLGFKPKQFVNYVDVIGVSTESGKLVVKLKLF